MKKILIEIDENIYTRLFDNGEDYTIANDDLFMLAKAIRNGTPLPEHVRLVDIDKAEKEIRSYIANNKDSEDLFLYGLSLVCQKPITEICGNNFMQWKPKQTATKEGE